MKKSLLFLMLTLMGLTMMAKPVDPDRAVLIAKNFVSQYVKGADQMTATVVYTHPMQGERSKVRGENGERPAMYVVNIGNMFVIVAADDIAHPVLGYSLSRPWPVQTENGKKKNENEERSSLITQRSSLPPQVASYLDDLANQIESAVGQQSVPDRETTTEWHQLTTEHLTLNTNLPDSVGPLLTTTWDQGQYYNALCPEDANGYAGHVPTGCVATAMAQIINYWGYPVHGRGTHSYNTGYMSYYSPWNTYGTLTVNFDSANYDYSHMSNILTASSIPQEVQAVATLMRDCGVAADMSYSSSESSSYGVAARAGLINFFRFNPNLSLAEKLFFSNNEWENMLRSDLDDGHPIYYSGYGSGGHAFVCDGYKDSNYFHFNFGWSGYADGWYLTSAVNPGTMDFNSQQSALLGIFPDSTGNVILGQLTGSSTFIVDEPLEFNHIMGHNMYDRINSLVRCENNVYFVSSDTTKQLVVDKLSYDRWENLSIFDSINSDDDSWLAGLHPDGEPDMSPNVSSSHAITFVYIGGCIHGFKIRISQESECRMVSNVITDVDTSFIQLGWQENGISSQWRIEYGPVGFLQGEGKTVVVDTNSVIINDTIGYKPYEIHIQPICDTISNNNVFSLVLKERIYWSDVVTSEPDGYSVDSLGTIHITSPEGLGWMARVAEQAFNSYSVDSLGVANFFQNVSIDNDLDMSNHIWKPIRVWEGNINGNGHVINNLKIDMVVRRYGGLFSEFGGDTIKDLGFKNAKINRIYDAERIGTLVGLIQGNTIIMNCYSADFDFHSYPGCAGGLIGQAENNITFNNCYVSGSLTASVGAGGLVGDGQYYSFYNCYSSIHLLETNGLKGLLRGGCGSIRTFDNCFADIDYVPNTWATDESGYFFGSPEIINHLHNIAGFTRASNTFAHTVPEMSINYYYDGSIDLVTALNQGVIEQNNPSLRTWVWDSLTGLPVFGNYYDVTCPNVSDISASNTLSGNSWAVALSWQENGSAGEWQIKSLPSGVIDEDSAIYYTSYTTHDTLVGLTLGRKYDIYVRPVCAGDSIAHWGTKITHIFDKLYWTDVVTSCPEGYVEDSDGNVVISSAEGLAWLSVCSNGLHGQTKNSYEGISIHIVNDIDLGQYKWMPIGWHKDTSCTECDVFMGTLYGHNHTISNLYCYENDETNEASYLGLIGEALFSTIQDVNIENIYLKGFYKIGALAGVAGSCNIHNCHIKNDTIYGVFKLGGIVGETVFYDYWSQYGGQPNEFYNISATGIIYGDQSVGGLIGSWGNGSDTSNYGIIKNCYADVDINNMNKRTSQSKGGLIGFAGNTNIHNCYCKGFMSQAGRSGYSIGACYNVFLMNVYAVPSNGFPFSYSIITSFLSDTSSLVNGTLVSSVTIDTTSYTNLLDALNAWVDAYDTAGIYRHWAADSTNENEGFPVFAYVPCIPVISTDSIVVCDSYNWHGNIYTTSTELIDTLSTMMGCDSIVTHHLIVNHSTMSTETTSACDSYTWIDGNTYTASTQNSTFTIQNSFGCDSVVTLNLTVNHSAETIVTDSAETSYTWHGITFTESGIYPWINKTTEDCDSTETLNLTITNPSQGQWGWNQSTACPGWNNPANFTVGSTRGSYSGHAVNISSNDKPCPNPLTGNTGVSSMGSTYLASQLAGVTSTGSTCSNIPEQHNQYRVMTELNAYDPNTGYNLPYVPTHFNTHDTTPGTINTMLTRSIRIGDGCSAGGNNDGESGAALYYTMQVTPDNAMMILYYALVSQASTHGQQGNPTFVIRVMKQNFPSSNYWVPVSDTMAYYMSLTPSGTSQDNTCPNMGYITLADSGQIGWHQHGNVLYKDWERVSIDLTYYMYQTLQIQVMIYDDIDNERYAYGYIAGECRPMRVSQSGCQAGTSTNVTELSAPQGMTNYVWYASEFGAVDPSSAPMFEPGGMYDFVTWRPLTDTTTSPSRYLYPVQASDFLVTRQRVNETTDTVNTISNRQTFRCEITSAIDPNKPYKTYLYTTVQNLKPVMDVDSPMLCDGTARLQNRSYVPGDSWGVVNDSTRWWFYDNANCTGTPVATFIGDSASYHYEGNDLRGVRVRTLTYDSTCYSEAIYTLHPYHGSTSDTTAVACESYTWHNNTYLASGTPTYSATNAEGCDSTVTLNLTINNPVPIATTETACETYTWNGTAYTANGNYTYTLLDSNGCTQVDTLHLTINHNSSGTETTSACDSYTWIDGNTYTASTQNSTFTIQNSFGCDSTVTLHLTVNYSSTATDTATACDSYTWIDGNIYTSSTQNSTFTTLNSHGCDSTVTLHLTLNYSSTGDTSTVACESYTWQGSTYTISGDITGIIPLQNTVGCDSIVTLHLTISNPIHAATNETACETYTWNGTPYTASGNYTYSHLDANGCTQVDTLHMTINYSNAVNETDTACENYFFGGEWISVSGQYIDSLTNIAGCDSIVTLNLTINNPVHVAITKVACDSYTWQGATLTVSGDYTYPHDDANGCTQVDTLHLTINYGAETTVTDTAEDSYTWQGTTYTESGTYQWVGTTAEGCDSTVTLILTITTSQEGIDESGVTLVRLTVTDGRIIVDEAGGQRSEVRVYDVMGRQYPPFTSHISPFTLSNGVYLVKIGDYPARRVVVIR